ncbi:MAG: hypothetical protein SNJ52_04170 [Verrucomicrobiia bacterium]
MWPKTLVFYPVALVALVCAGVSYFFGAHPHEKEIRKFVNERAELITSGGVDRPMDPDRLLTLNEALLRGRQVDKVLGWVFFVTLAIGLFAICIETEIRWALIWFVSLVAIVLGLILLNQQFQFLPAFVGQIFAVDPSATPQFYLGITTVWLLLYIVSLLIIRFHYVRIEANEVFVMHGLLEGQRRFSTLQMKYEKDVTDVLEYYLPLVNSGKLILSFPGQEKIILENVRRIDAVIARLNDLTSKFNVGLRV